MFRKRNLVLRNIHRFTIIIFGKRRGERVKNSRRLRFEFDLWTASRDPSHDAARMTKPKQLATMYRVDRLEVSFIVDFTSADESNKREIGIGAIDSHW